MEEYVEYDSNEEEPEEQLQAPTVRPTKISFAESRAKVSAVQSQKLSTSPSASKDEANNEWKIVNQTNLSIDITK